MHAWRLWPTFSVSVVDFSLTSLFRLLGTQQLIQAAILKFGWSVFIVVSIAYFIRSLLLYINFRAQDNDHTPEERLYGTLLCVFFSVCIIILTVFLQQTNYVSSRLGVKVQVKPRIPSHLHAREWWMRKKFVESHDWGGSLRSNKKLFFGAPPDGAPRCVAAAPCPLRTMMCCCMLQCPVHTKVVLAL
jgi:hypothetical protein